MVILFLSNGLKPLFAVAKLALDVPLLMLVINKNGRNF